MLKFFKNPFAIIGTRAAVPATDPGTGEVNYPTGYPAQYQLPKTDPLSRNIERDKMNQLFFDTQQAIAELQSRGTPDFITTALNEGVAFEYLVGDRVRYDDGVNGPRVFVSRINANTDLPTVPGSWAPAREFSPNAVAGGTANALTATLVPALGLMPAGTVFYLRHAAANTGAVTLALNGGAAKPVTNGAGTALEAGDIPGAASWGQYVYDLTSDRYVLLNSISYAFRGANQTLAASGFQRLPGGLIMQFGATVVAASTTQTVSLPIAFPSTFCAVAGVSNTVSLNPVGTPYLGIERFSASQIRIQNVYASSPLSIGWLAFGY